MKKLHLGHRARMLQQNFIPIGLQKIIEMHMEFLRQMEFCLIMKGQHGKKHLLQEK